jgi:hypothetical protein
METDQINAALLRAKAAFLQADRDLLALDANERSMTHKFAEHLQREFPDWHVDCEYNRRGDATKFLEWMDNHVPPDDENARTVFPDIIVHHRNTTDNLLVIEAKKSGNANNLDQQKIDAFLSSSDYKYSYGVLITFVTREPHDIIIEPRAPVR